MKIWLTEISAIDPLTGKMQRYSGPEIIAPSKLMAVAFVRDKYPYCKVLGQITRVIKHKDDTETISYSYDTIPEHHELN